MGALLDLLADFGAVTVPPGGVTRLARAEPSTRALPVITPLGRWAAEALAARLPRAAAPDASPAEVIVAAAQAARAGRWAIVHRWLGARTPEVAVRELLGAATTRPESNSKASPHDPAFEQVKSRAASSVTHVTYRVLS